MKNKKLWLTIGISVILIGVIVYVNSHRNRERCEVLVGMVADQTGALALYGNWAVNGANLAVEKINKGGGINGCELKLSIQDSQSLPQVAVSAVRYLIDTKKVPAIIIATGTGLVMAAAPISNEKQSVLFATLASGPIITTSGDFVFRDRISGTLEVIGVANFAVSKNIKSMALALLDNEAGRSYEQAFRSAYEKVGGRIVDVEWLDPGGSDYRTQILKMKVHKDLQGVFFGANVKEIGLFIKQAKELRFHSRWMAMTSVETDELFKIVGDAAEGLIYAAEAYDFSNPVTAEFDNEYFMKYREHSQNYAANNYDAVMLIAQAIAKGEKTGPQIRNYLYRVRNYQGVSGLMSFDENGDVNKSVVLKVIRNRQFELYAPNNK